MIMPGDAKPDSHFSDALMETATAIRQMSESKLNDIMRQIIKELEENPNHEARVRGLRMMAHAPKGHWEANEELSNALWDAIMSVPESAA